MPKFGPTGEFPFGKPMQPKDRGGLNAAFARVPNKRAMVMYFGTMVSYVAMRPQDTQIIIKVFRVKVVQHFGMLAYNKAELPIRHELDRTNQLIIAYLPQSASSLEANPEMWLAWAEVLEDNLKQLREMH